jgi:4-amino-4-deoxy-L-arabinose transferase-like glycosyltransferase
MPAGQPYLSRRSDLGGRLVVMTTSTAIPLDRDLPVTSPPPRAAPPTRHRRGDGEDPTWARPALFALLGATAVLYLWGLGASGTANDFYAAAVQAGTKSWQAFFFGSFDASNFITVDKPPASLWVMELSGRVFGFNSWSMLVPQALEGVAAVGVLYAAVRRWAGPKAGLLAGAVFATTPVAALMFRFNNPDALLLLLLVAAAYAMVRAVETGSNRWVVFAGTAIGFAFLTKMMQATLVVPAFAVVYLVAAPVSLRRRVTGLLAGAAAIAVSAGWWVATVELWPAGSRPYIGGSTDNSILNLIFGYNGIGRITGSGDGAGRGGNFSGATGLTRLFGTEMGGEISWLLPAALITLAGGLWVTRRAPRTDRTRAALLLWGGWLLVTAIVFSYASGIIHPYYTVALAPAIAAVIAVGARELWRTRERLTSRLALAAAVGLTGWWAFVLLDRTPTWHPALRYTVGVTAALAAVGLLAIGRMPARAAVGVALAAVIATTAAPAAYALATAATPHTGSTPSSGPASARSAGFGGAPSGSGPSGSGPSGGTGSGGTPPSGTRPSGGSAPSSTAPSGTAPSGTAPGGKASSGATTGTTVGGTMMGGATTSSALTALLRSGSGYTWAAATVGSQTAASLELASGRAVMSIGGFSGTDPTPTLATFESYVSAKKIHYFVTGGGGPSGNGGSQITAWVKAHFTAKTVGGQTVYDLTQPTST